MMKPKIVLLLFFILFNCSKIKKQIGQEEIVNKNDPIEHYDIEVIGMKEGLCSNNIKDIIIDNNEIYCLGETCLTKIQMHDGKIINFSFTNQQFLFIQKLFDKVLLVKKNGVDEFQNNQLYSFISLENIESPLMEIHGELYCYKKNEGIYHLNLDEKKYNLIYGITNINLKKIESNSDEIILCDGKKIYAYNTVSFVMTNFFISPTEEIDDFIYENQLFYYGHQNIYFYHVINNIRDKLVSLRSNEYMTCLYKDKNILYIGKNYGITVYDLNSRQKYDILDAFLVKDAYINSIISDENTVFIGTRNYGLIKYFKNTI